MRCRITRGWSGFFVAFALSSGFAAAASADTIWTNWTSATVGAPGSASGVLGTTTVSYSGELLNYNIIGSSSDWSPNSSFIGGSVTASPSVVGDILYLNGSYTGVNRITFAQAVVNPYIAIWSLGQSGSPASFIFQGATPTLQAGGPNSSFGGQSITVNGTTVSGSEGNGVVQFNGVFTSLSWTNTFENYYGFTVGAAGVVPEPATIVTLGIGLVGVGLASRHLRRKARA
ncbi:MAG: PEP-CTERM sorting domain-containing protein [Isosphaeraceae bacterium]